MLTLDTCFFTPRNGVQQIFNAFTQTAIFFFFTFFSERLYVTHFPLVAGLRIPASNMQTTLEMQGEAHETLLHPLKTLLTKLQKKTLINCMNKCTTEKGERIAE